MKLSDWADVSTVIQAIFVAISLIFILFQLRQGNKLARAANAQALAEQAAAFNALLYQDEKLAQLWYSGGKNLEDLDKMVDKHRYRELIGQWLIFHENIYYQWRQGLLDKDIYDGWHNDLRFTVHRHNLSLITSNIEKYFPNKFGILITQLQSAKYLDEFRY